jgi:hypothetical protein
MVFAQRAVGAGRAALAVFGNSCRPTGKVLPPKTTDSAKHLFLLKVGFQTGPVIAH